MPDTVLDLILWRHAEAETEALGNDLARPLTSKGHQQALAMAHWLEARLPRTAQVLCSPALRARQTADALLMRYTIDERLAPDGLLSRALSLTKTRRGTTVLVGHQPMLGQLASFLMTGIQGDSDTAGEWAVRRGGIWWLRIKPRHGALHTTVRAVLCPEYLRTDGIPIKQQNQHL